MGHDILDAQLLGIGSAVQQVLDALCAEGDGNDAEGFGAFGEVPALGAGPAAPESGDLNAELFAQALDHIDGLLGPGGDVPADQLAVLEALSSGGGELFSHALMRLDDNNTYIHDSFHPFCNHKPFHEKRDPTE